MGAIKLNLYDKFNELLDKQYITFREYKVMMSMYKSYVNKKPSKKGKAQDNALIKSVFNETTLSNKSKDDNTAVLNHIQQVNMITKPTLESPASIKRCAIDYLTLCRDNGMKPTTSGLALAMGISRLTLLKYASGELRCQNKEVIQEALQMIETFLETELISGKINPVSGIFVMKNNHNWDDKSSITIKSENKELNEEEIKKKYLKEEDIINVDADEDK